MVGKPDATIAGTSCEIQHGGGLGIGETDRAQPVMTRHRDRLGTHGTLAEINHSSMNGVSGLGG